MQPPGIFTDKAWHSQCKSCLTTPSVPAEEQGLPEAQPSFPTPQWEGKWLLQLCHKGGLVKHTSINSLLWAVPGRLSPHPTTMGHSWINKGLKWHYHNTNTHKALDSSAWSKCSWSFCTLHIPPLKQNPAMHYGLLPELNILLNLAY